MKFKSFRNKIIILLCSLFISGCYNFKIVTDVSDADIRLDGNKIVQNTVYKSKKNQILLSVKRYGYKEINKIIGKTFPFGATEISLSLQPEKFSIELNVAPAGTDVFSGDKKLGRTPVNIDLDYGNHNLFLEAPGYPKEEVILKASYNGKYYLKHHKEEMKIKQLGIFKCGPQPKQVIFSPDDKFIYIVLLDGLGYQIFDMDKMSISDYIKVPDESQSRGFPEGLFIKEKNVFWISQMNTGLLYEYSYPENKYLRTINAEGTWSKFLAWSDELSLVAVSNWASNNVSIIDYESGTVIKKIATAPAPRGLVFTDDSKYLYVTSYDGGVIYKIKTSGWSAERTIKKDKSCMRHAVLTKDNKTLFVSDMYYSLIYEIDTESFEIKNFYKVFEKPNTISLSEDDKFLFVSSRGPNDKESYLKRSPENGKITIISLEKKEIISSFEAGNQPTALGVSNDGRFICASDFRDDAIELFYIGDLR